MTSPTPEPPAWQTWAWKQAGVPVDASSKEATAAFLSALEKTDFAPSADLRAALQLKSASENASAQPKRALATFRKSRVQTLNEAIEKFALRYWSMAPGQRREVHARLLAAAKNNPLAKLRLESLQEGLTISTVTEAVDDPTRALAVRVQEIYVLGPMDRPVRRQELADSLRSESGGSITFQLLGEDYPDIARLEKNLNPRSIAPPKKPAKPKLPRTTDLLPASQKGSSYRSDLWSRFNPGISGRFVWLAILLLSGGLRTCSTINNSPNRPTIEANNKLPDSLKDVQLRIVTRPDGKKAVEMVDKDGNVVDVNGRTQKSKGK